MDSRDGGVQGDDGRQGLRRGSPVRAVRVRGAVDDEAGVDARAVGAAHPIRAFDALSHQLGLLEVQGARVIGRDVSDLTRGDQQRIALDVASRQRHLQVRVVQHVGGLEGVQVPIYVIGQHDRGVLGQGDGDGLGGQLRPRLRAVGRPRRVHVEARVGDHFSGETFECLVVEGKRDRVRRVRRDGPVALVVSDITAVESLDVVLVLWDGIGATIQLKSAVLDPVGVAANHGPKVRVVIQGVLDVLARIVEANCDVLRQTVAVGHPDRD